MNISFWSIRGDDMCYNSFCTLLILNITLNTINFIHDCIFPFTFEKKYNIHIIVDILDNTLHIKFGTCDLNQQKSFKILHDCY